MNQWLWIWQQGFWIISDAQLNVVATNASVVVLSEDKTGPHTGIWILISVCPAQRGQCFRSPLQRLCCSWGFGWIMGCPQKASGVWTCRSPALITCVKNHTLVELLGEDHAMQHFISWLCILDLIWCVRLDCCWIIKSPRKSRWIALDSYDKRLLINARHGLEEWQALKCKWTALTKIWFCIVFQTC